MTLSSQAWGMALMRAGAARAASLVRRRQAELVTRFGDARRARRAFARQSRRALADPFEPFWPPEREK